MQKYSKYPFPPYKFLPGKAPHPEKEGYLKGVSLSSTQLNEENFFENQEYLFSLDLINKQYYWEAHVYLEVIWNTHHRKGPIADFLKSLIKICAAGVKFELEEHKETEVHLMRSNELLQDFKQNTFLGLELEKLKNLTLKDLQQKLSLELILPKS